MLVKEDTNRRVCFNERIQFVYVGIIMGEVEWVCEEIVVVDRHEEMVFIVHAYTHSKRRATR
jgi:hypothetical protein